MQILLVGSAAFAPDADFAARDAAQIAMRQTIHRMDSRKVRRELEMNPQGSQQVAGPSQRSGDAR
ncbi:MAG TPA: hypothetical protein VKY92_08780 [Verrucomicrobiae bacterium]|nr:hypothetical protein [Verrucomicrobiae bacterium]